MKYRSISKNNKSDNIYIRIGYMKSDFYRPKYEIQVVNFKIEFLHKKLNSFLNFLNLLNFLPVFLQGEHRDSMPKFGGMDRW